MTISPEKSQQIKESTEIYKHEITALNALINKEQNDVRLDMLYHLRALSTIEHCSRIGLMDSEDLDESYAEAISKEVSRYFPHKDDAELFDDIAILDDEIKNRYFDNPQMSKKTIMDTLNIAL
ncbi:MAG: hypothetical protein PHO27_11820 [Sulfuricurvum sp.]|nr:hypothetical protein [Sulfuricurvum sp.]